MIAKHLRVRVSGVTIRFPCTSATAPRLESDMAPSPGTCTRRIARVGLLVHRRAPPVVALLAMLGHLMSCAVEDGKSVSPTPPKASSAECVQHCRNDRQGGCERPVDLCELACAQGGGAVGVVEPTFASAQAPVGPVVRPALLGQSVGIETLGGTATPLLPRCSKLPTEHHATFTTASDNQTRVEIHLVAGEDRFAAKNRALARIAVTGIPSAPRGGPQIDVAFHVALSGRVSVTARDQETGAARIVEQVESGGSRPPHQDQ